MGALSISACPLFSSLPLRPHDQMSSVQAIRESRRTFMFMLYFSHACSTASLHSCFSFQQSGMFPKCHNILNSHLFGHCSLLLTDPHLILYICKWSGHFYQNQKNETIQYVVASDVYLSSAYSFKHFMSVLNFPNLVLRCIRVQNMCPAMTTHLNSPVQSFSV